MECQLGDWVCFYQSGELVLAEVRYRVKALDYPYRWKLYTDHGSVNEDDVIEARRASAPEER